MRVACAVVGSGNIGTDLVIKLTRSSELEPVAMVGIDPESDGLKRARSLGLDVSHAGVDWLLENADRLGVELVFEATSAHVHRANASRYEDAGLIAIDLTPAAVGPGVVPAVNLKQHIDASNVNMITCGGQATVPIVAAVAQTTTVAYAEIVSAVASRSAGPGTRQNIDEFTLTTAHALESIGGAARGKAIIVLNPAREPILMRNTVFCALPEGYDKSSVADSIMEMAKSVAEYVPGYRVKAKPVFDDGPYETPGGPAAGRVVILLEVAGAGDYLPAYAGNLDIMTAAAVQMGGSMARARFGVDQ